MAAQAPTADLGWEAPEFLLPATDGKSYTLDDLKGERGTVVMFLCNHCPYVQAMIDRTSDDAAALALLGVNTIAICSNDAVSYPEDSFEHMRVFAEHHALPFPYLHDETQKVARAYGAVCTPDIFGFDDRLRLRYRGRLDEGRTETPRPGAKRELLEAMRLIAETGEGPAEQHPAIGCSIKWK